MELIWIIPGVTVELVERVLEEELVVEVPVECRMGLIVSIATLLGTERCGFLERVVL